MDDQRSLEAQLLGEMTYDDPRKKQQAPAVDPRLAGASAPLLDDMDGGSYSAPPKPQSQYQGLTAEQIAILQQQRAAKGQPPYTDEEIAELNADFIERQRQAAQQAAMAAQAAAQQQAAAMLLQEPEEAYVPTEKKSAAEFLPEVNASDLLEEPAPEPERKISFNQEDLEAAKKQAAKRASESLTEVPAKTEEDMKRQRREMEALRQQQLADLAQGGFTVSIILTIIGVIAGACMAIFAGGKYPDPESVPGFFTLADKFYLYGGIILALLSVTIVLRVQAVKGFTSFMFIVSSILMVIPGIVVLLEKRDTAGFGLIVVAYVLGVIGCFAVTFTLSTSDKLNAYYGKKEIMYD